MDFTLQKEYKVAQQLFKDFAEKIESLPKMLELAKKTDYSITKFNFANCRIFFQIVKQWAAGNSIKRNKMSVFYVPIKIMKLH